MCIFLTLKCREKLIKFADCQKPSNSAQQFNVLSQVEPLQFVCTFRSLAVKAGIQNQLMSVLTLAMRITADEYT